MKCEFSDIVVTPDHLDFEIKEGSQFVPPSQHLNLKKTTAGLTPLWKSWVSEDWLALIPSTGDAPEKVRVIVKSIGMSAGEYHAQVTITSRSVTVTPSVIPVT